MTSPYWWYTTKLPTEISKEFSPLILVVLLAQSSLRLVRTYSSASQNPIILDGQQEMNELGVDMAVYH